MLHAFPLFRARSLATCIAVVAVGCSEHAKSNLDTSTATPPSQSAAARTTSGPDAAHVLRLASTYTYPDSQKPFNAKVHIKKKLNKGVKKGQEPSKIVIARAEPVPGTVYPLEEEVLALIYSSKDYSGLGIEQGDNYLWRDKTTGEVWMVSKKSSGLTKLERDTIAYSHKDPHERRLVLDEFQGKNPAGVLMAMVALGVCLDDPACGGHCGYSQ